MDQPFAFNIQKQAAPLRQQVLDGLRQAIITGQLAPGQRLIERELTKMMEVSRTVIREVLRQLETEGLIALIPNKGPVVRELTVEEAEDLYHIRAVLEGYTAKLFAENASDELIETLEKSLDAVAKAYDKGDAEQVLESKNQFYTMLYEGARNKTLGSMLYSLHARVWRWRALGLTHPKRSMERSQESVKNLRAILAAIKKRDADAAERIMREEASKAALEVMRLLAK